MTTPRVRFTDGGATVANGDQSQIQCTDNGAQLVTESGGKVITVVPVMETSATASGDVIAIPIETADAFRSDGGTMKLTSVVALDADDQGQNFDLVFFNSTVLPVLGTLNAAVSISDEDAAEIVGIVNVTNWQDLINSQVAVETGLNIVMSAASGSKSLWVGVVCREGTPTYTASGITLQLGFEAV